MYSNDKIKLEKCEGGGDKVGEKRAKGGGEARCEVEEKVRDVVGKVLAGRRFFVFLMAKELQRIENRSILAVSIKLTQKWENTMTIA